MSNSKISIEQHIGTYKTKINKVFIPIMIYDDTTSQKAWNSISTLIDIKAELANEKIKVNDYIRMVNELEKKITEIDTVTPDIADNIANAKLIITNNFYVGNDKFSPLEKTYVEAAKKLLDIYDCRDKLDNELTTKKIEYENAITSINSLIKIAENKINMLVGMRRIYNSKQ